jgi:Zn finger protein HypA/HybF involved in hydrogenase expression
MPEYKPDVDWKTAMEQKRVLHEVWQEFLEDQPTCPTCGAPWYEYGWDHESAYSERISACCENFHEFVIDFDDGFVIEERSSKKPKNMEPTSELHGSEEGPYERDTLEDFSGEGILRKSRWQKEKMEWYVLGKNVICFKCLERMPKEKRRSAIRLAKVDDGISCAKCGAAPLAVRKGAVVLLEAGEKVYCPTCAKERESVLLQKAVMVASLEDDDIAPTPLWCDRCGEPLSVTISEEAATVLHKTIEGLETIVFNKNLRDIRPSLWRRALEWKEKLEDYLLKANVYKKSGKAES